MPSVIIIKYVPIGSQNDQVGIAKALKEEPFRKLKKVKLTSDGDRLELTFTKKVWDERSNNYQTFPKQILQVSKKKHNDVHEHIVSVLNNEQKPCSVFKKQHGWLVLDIIELKDKWLVFLV